MDKALDSKSGRFSPQGFESYSREFYIDILATICSVYDMDSCSSMIVKGFLNFDIGGRVVWMITLLAHFTIFTVVIILLGWIDDRCCEFQNIL